VYGTGGFDSDAFSEGLAALCQFGQFGNEERLATGQYNVRRI
jgi:hypothetical protein